MDGNMRHLMRSLAAALVMATLLTGVSFAQPFPESARQKAAEANKKAEQKATDEAYKATLKNTHDVRKAADPWANLRTDPARNDK